MSQWWWKHISFGQIKYSGGVVYLCRNSYCEAHSFGAYVQRIPLKGDSGSMAPPPPKEKFN